MSAWLLPDHIADVLPLDARRLESLRRKLIDTAGRYGYELVIPPLIEHLDSLLTGTGRELSLQTFKLVDQLSGRSLGLRADTTPQVARIDAHLLGHKGIVRLCYCGPVLHTRSANPKSTREPLQFGAEIYGYHGRRADLEILCLALDCLRQAEVPDLSVDLADARIVRALLSQVPEADPLREQIHQALASKNRSQLQQLATRLAPEVAAALTRLPQLFGGSEVLQQARQDLPAYPEISQALDDLQHISERLHGARLFFDLADARGWGYYSGLQFSIYAPDAGQVLLRGGRYDGVGAAFVPMDAEQRPAVGFSLDLKSLLDVSAADMQRAHAIQAPWGDASDLLAAIEQLRAQGETVICAHKSEINHLFAFICDRQLIHDDGQWVVQTIEI